MKTWKRQKANQNKPTEGKSFKELNPYYNFENDMSKKQKQRIQ